MLVWKMKLSCQVPILFKAATGTVTELSILSRSFDNLMVIILKIDLASQIQILDEIKQLSSRGPSFQAAPALLSKRSQGWIYCLPLKRMPMILELFFGTTPQESCFLCNSYFKRVKSWIYYSVFEDPLNENTYRTVAFFYTTLWEACLLQGLHFKLTLCHILTWWRGGG